MVVDCSLFVVVCVLCLYFLFMYIVFNMYLMWCFRILVVVDALLFDVVCACCVCTSSFLYCV